MFLGRAGLALRRARISTNIFSVLVLLINLLFFAMFFANVKTAIVNWREGVTDPSNLLMIIVLFSLPFLLHSLDVKLRRGIQKDIFEYQWTVGDFEERNIPFKVIIPTQREVNGNLDERKIELLFNPGQIYSTHKEETKLREKYQ